MKKFMCICLILLSIFTLISCATSKKTEKPNIEEVGLTESGEFLGYNYNNSLDLDNIIKNYYSISELKKYFGNYSHEEKEFFRISIDLDENKYKINEVNKSFKIECLRKGGNVYYCAYKVKEGGYYYVFWTPQYQKDSNNVIDAVSNYQVYIDNLKSNKDFKSIKVGKSSYAEVKKIDESTVLSIRSNMGRFSYTLLSDGELLKIKYRDKLEKETFGGLIVEQIEVVPKSNNSILSSIFYKDLPNTKK